MSAERLCDYRCFGSIDTLNNHFAGSGLRPKYLIADCDTIPFDAAGKSWVRLAAWDSAGNGAFVQPVWLAVQ